MYVKLISASHNAIIISHIWTSTICKSFYRIQTIPQTMVCICCQQLC